MSRIIDHIKAAMAAELAADADRSDCLDHLSRGELLALEKAASRGGLFQDAPPNMAAKAATSSRMPSIAVVIRARTVAAAPGVAKVTALEMFSSVNGRPASCRISTVRIAWLFTAIAVISSSLSFIAAILAESFHSDKGGRP